MMKEKTKTMREDEGGDVDEGTTTGHDVPSLSSQSKQILQDSLYCGDPKKKSRQDKWVDNDNFHL